MKFKHSEPLEVPPWKKRQRKGEGGKEKKGKICGFDAGISPWGMAGWLALAGTGIRSAFTTFATFPKTPFRAIPRQQVQDKLGGRRDGSGRESRSGECEVDGSGESGMEWMRNEERGAAGG